MNKKKITLGLAALAIGGLIFTSTSIEAYRGDPSQEGPNCTDDRYEAIEQAFENNDYQAWKELMQGKGRVTQVINESNFNRFAEAHRLGKEGNIEEANQVRQELGLGQGDGSTQVQGRYGKRHIRNI